MRLCGFCPARPLGYTNWQRPHLWDRRRMGACGNSSIKKQRYGISLSSSKLLRHVNYAIPGSSFRKYWSSKNELRKAKDTSSRHMRMWRIFARRLKGIWRNGSEITRVQTQISLASWQRMTSRHFRFLAQLRKLCPERSQISIIGWRKRKRSQGSKGRIIPAFCSALKKRSAQRLLTSSPRARDSRWPQRSFTSTGWKKRSPRSRRSPMMLGWPPTWKDAAGKQPR